MSRLTLWRGALVLGTVLLLMSSVSLAQPPTGNLHGTVINEDGEALPGVAITVSGLGADRHMRTGDQGEFRFLSLDPGQYDISAALEGFSGVEWTVQVAVGRNTNLEMTMQAGIEEVITVTSESPLLDEKKQIEGTTITQIELEKIPTARDPWSVMSQTPGVLVDRVNVGGSESGQQSLFRAPAVSWSQNDFLVDGVQITDMRATGASSTYYDFDQFTEMQFVTGGTDVTKNTSGVSINLVTKRGTNEFRGSARFITVKAGGVFGGALAQSHVDVTQGDMGPGQDIDDYVGAQIREIEEVGFEVGGAAKQDKVWVWGSYGQNTIQQNAASGTADDTILENTSLKVNAQLNENNSAVGSWNNGDKLKFGRGASFTRPDNTTWNQRGPSAIYRFEDTHVFSSNFFLTGTYSLSDFGFALAAKAGTGSSAPEAWRRSDGVWQDNYLSGSAAAVSPNNEFKVDGSYFFNTGNVDHELKVGGRLRTYESSSNFAWPGRDMFTYNTSSTTFVVAKRGIATPTEMEYQSLWAQDTISFGKVTANIGLRYDDQSGVNKQFKVAANPMVPLALPELDYPGAGADFSMKDIAPRLGITYALGAERQTLLRASYARFADQLGVGTVTRTNPAGYAYAYFVAPYNDGPYTGDGSEFNDPDAVVFADGFDPSDPAALIDPDMTDPGLDAAITEEMVIKVEHALMPEFVVTGGITFRTVKDIHESRSIIRNPNGTTRTINRNDYVPDGFLTGSLPGGVSGGSASNYAVPLFALRGPLDRTGGSFLTNGSREREYFGYQVTFTKRLANRWMLRGYLNIGEGEWQVDDAYRFNSNPNRAENGGDEDGDLYLVRVTGSGKGERFIQSGWSFNVNGMYQVAPDKPWGFNISANIVGREGFAQPYAAVTPLSDGSAPSIGVVDDFDKYRLDDLATIDLRVEKEVALSAPVNLTLGIDLFNATNQATEMSRNRDVEASRAFYLNDNVSPRVYRFNVRLAWK